VDDETPLFGIVFVDTATGAFSLTEFQDDVELTKFETFVAQIRPKELILEKVCTYCFLISGLFSPYQGCISKRAVRILKNNTALTTIWNKLTPGKEFWDATTTIRELNSQGYFRSDGLDGSESWPEALQSVKSRELVMSSLGALLCYLQTVRLSTSLLCAALVQLLIAQNRS